MKNTHIKIGDFGFSAKVDTFRTLVGTFNYMDPIILKKFKKRTNLKDSESFDKTCDIWSLGSICFELITGERVFNGKSLDQIYEKVEEGNYSLPLSLSKEIVSFINGMLQYDPKKRLTIEKLAAHPFLKKNVKEFSKIHLSKLQSRIVDEELKINTRKNESIWSIFNDDENFLRSISSTFFDEFPHHNQPNINIPIFQKNSGLRNKHLQNNYEENKTNNYAHFDKIPETNTINNINNNDSNKLSNNHNNDMNEKNSFHGKNNIQTLKNNNFNNRINNNNINNYYNKLAYNNININNFYNKNINKIPKPNTINNMHYKINNNINSNNRDNYIYNNINNNLNMVNNNFYKDINNNLNNNTNNINSYNNLQQNINNNPHYIENMNKKGLENKNSNNNLNRDILNNINSLYNSINDKENNIYKKVYDSQNSNEINNLVNKNSNNISQAINSISPTTQYTNNGNLYNNNVLNNNYNNSRQFDYNNVNPNYQAQSNSSSIGAALIPIYSNVDSINQFNDKYY